MRRSLASIALACLAIAGVAPSASAASGPAAPRGYVQALFLLHHPAGLSRFVRSVSDPESPQYRHYATVEGLVKRFGASALDRRTTLSWLTAHGIRGRVGPTGAYLTVRMPGKLAGRVLPRRAPAGGSATDVATFSRRIPPALRGHVDSIGILGSRPGAFGHAASVAPASIDGAAASGGSSLLPHSGTAAGCPSGRAAGAPSPLSAFTPNQYLTAYGHEAMHRRGLRGSGLSAAVVEIDGFRHSDIATFGRCFGVRVPPIRVILAGPRKLLEPADETTLDLEVLSAAAPELKRIYVYEGGSSEAGIMRTVAAALGSRGHHPDAISISLGGCEPQLNLDLAFRRALDNIFAVAAGAGISTLVAAGDQGSSACAVETPDHKKTALPLLAVSDPASSPFVTAVGGTNLELNAKNRIASQITWNDAPDFFGGGGGGISLLSPRRPWWQRLPHLHEYGAGRLVPDIAGLADVLPGYAIYCTATACAEAPQASPGWVSIGGTSAATPLMAGGVLLADQYAARHRQPPLGFLNPLLYELGAEKAGRNVLSDVTKGNNDLGVLTPVEAGGGQPLGCCPATPGYDIATGWGSLKVEGLAKAARRAAAR
jgi:subtilase family serine protease